MKPVHLNTLVADVRIAKGYSRDPVTKAVQTTSYPMVYEFSSMDFTVNNVDELAGIIQFVAAEGGTLIKGQLSRTLTHESRAGATDSFAPTNWIVLDLDGINKYQSIDEFLVQIGLPDISYVLQWSSSMGIENKFGFRCHIFMLMEKYMAPSILKHWLMKLNLTVPDLASQCKLTSTGNSLLWPLDITTCQNDKLIYVATPTFDGVQDPYPDERITVHHRANECIPASYDFDVNIPGVKQQMDIKVTELRKAAGMTKRHTIKYAVAGEETYISNPTQAVVTGIKEERGYVYLNLNGGDSWGYWHPVEDPLFIRNFKGEALYRTQDLLPKYWATLQKQRVQTNREPGQRVYLAFRCLEDAQYYNGYADPATDELVLHRATNKSQLEDFLAQYDQQLPDPVEDWKMVYDPTDPTVVDVEAKRVNTFIASSYAKEYDSNFKVTQPPALIDNIFHHIMNYDPAMLAHWYHWLAWIVQHMDMTSTAWVWHGTQGTGKGLAFHHILKPLLGEHNVGIIGQSDLEEQYTAWAEGKLLIFIDEAHMSDERTPRAKTMARLKNMITEPTISIRRMYAGAKQTRNRTNFILASNVHAAHIEKGDRRFNVAEKQQKRLEITYEQANAIVEELPAFYAYLRQLPTCSTKVRTTVESKAKVTLINNSRTSVDEATDALRRGDLEYFVAMVPTPGRQASAKQGFKAPGYVKLVDELTKTRRNILTREDAFILMDFVLDNVPESPAKFNAFMRQHDLESKVHWIDGQAIRGYKIPWM